jgi:hypothetical protein
MITVQGEYRDAKPLTTFLVWKRVKFLLQVGRESTFLAPRPAEYPVYFKEIKIWPVKN